LNALNPIIEDVESSKQNLIHDINSSLSALQVALDVVTEGWQTNPELIDRILPLTLDKINQLQVQLLNFKIHST